MSLPIVQLSSVRTHSTGLRAYFHNPLQKPPGYIPLSISPLRTLLTPCQLPTYFSPFAPSLNFSSSVAYASSSQSLHPCFNPATRLFFTPFSMHVLSSPPPLSHRNREPYLVPSLLNKAVWDLLKKNNAMNYSR